MIKSYDINDYLKDDKELQKAVIRELFKEISTQQGKIDAYKMSENEANEIIAELKAYKDVNEDFKTAYAELKAENERLEFRVQKLSEDLSCSNKCLRNKIDIEHKYRTTLQEIKKYIAKICKEECGYVQKKRCPDCDCRYGAILDLITKAEEE